MFNTPKRSNQETTSQSIMCPPPPNRTSSSSRARLSAPSFYSSTVHHNMSTTSWAPIFAEVDLSDSSSPTKIDGYTHYPSRPPACPSLLDLDLDENGHQAGPINIKLQPRPCRQLSNDDGRQAVPIKVKPHSSYQHKF